MPPITPRNTAKRRTPPKAGIKTDASKGKQVTLPIPSVTPAARRNEDLLKKNTISLHSDTTPTTDSSNESVSADSDDDNGSPQTTNVNEIGQLLGIIKSNHLTLNFF